MGEEFSTKDGLYAGYGAGIRDCPDENIDRCQKKRSDIAKKVSAKNKL